jgi:hypothetical protein
LAAQVDRKLNMSWHHPDLYFFLCLLAGLAAFLAPTIIYEVIRKVRPRGSASTRTTKPIEPQMRRIVLIAAAVTGSAIGLIYALSHPGKIGLALQSFTLPSQPTSTSTACVIKGNISREGERIYHMPGQRYYDKTIVNWIKGERWFCTEQEAVRAGWRKAKV